MYINKKYNNNTGCKIDPLKLVLIGTFLNLIGDFLGFLAAFADVQEECQDTKSKSTNIINKSYAESRIKDLENEINILKKYMNNSDY